MMKVMMIMIFDDNYDDDNNDDDDNDDDSEYTCDQEAFGGAAGASTSRPPQQESHVYNPGAYGTQWWYTWPYGTHRPPQQSHVHIIGLLWCTWYIWYSTPCPPQQESLAYLGTMVHMECIAIIEHTVGRPPQHE